MPTPFGQAVSSDKRWFDRVWLLVVDTSRSLAVAAGMGFYLNTNVADGFAAVLHSGKQMNLRLSRTLRPDLDRMAVGPLSFEVIEGLKTVHLRLDASANDLGIGFDLTFAAGGPPWEEPHHFSMYEGRVLTDYTRFNQVGRAEGTIFIGGESFALQPEQSFAARDHSWGLRTGMGGYDPEEPPALLSEGLANWILFSIGNKYGYAQCREDRFGNVIECHGQFEGAAVTAFRHQLNLYPNSRRIRSGSIEILSGGETASFDVEAIMQPLNEQGCGYQRGFLDRRGLGARRGQFHAESDVWDVADPSTCRNLTFNGFEPQHRLWDNIVRLRSGESTGHAVYVLFAPATYEPYGFTAERP